MSQDTEDIIREAIQQFASAGRMSCQEARQVAEEAGADYNKVGRECDRLGIKIHSCQLGCF